MKFGESPFLTTQSHGGREHLSQEAIETTIDGYKLHNNFHIEVRMMGLLGHLPSR
jgi:hypothetical protein